MANEKRLIDCEQAKRATYEEIFWTESEQAVVRNFLAKLPKVDAVEVVEYIELREQYDKIFTEFHELRDAFVDYVCSGIPNPSPFCKNKCPDCCDSRGWCKNDDKCKGFNPAKIFMDGEEKDSSLLFADMEEIIDA